MTTPIEIIEKAKQIIEQYGADTVAGQFAQTVIDMNQVCSSELFGVYTHKLVLDEVPPCVHKINPYNHTLPTSQLGNHTYTWKRIDEES